MLMGGVIFALLVSHRKGETQFWDQNCWLTYLIPNFYQFNQYLKTFPISEGNYFSPPPYSSNHSLSQSSALWSFLLEYCKARGRCKALHPALDSRRIEHRPPCWDRAVGEQVEDEGWLTVFTSLVPMMPPISPRSFSSKFRISVALFFWWLLNSCSWLSSRCVVVSVVWKTHFRNKLEGLPIDFTHSATTMSNNMM